MNVERLFFSVGALSALLAVVAGAFASHTLKTKLDPNLLLAFEVAARYQMYHALALIALALAYARWSSSAVIVAGFLFIAGTLLFSGSLYALSLSGVPWLGAITPLGGVAFISGWALVAWGVLRAE